MLISKGSCLSDKCTEDVKRVYILLKEAEAVYKSLPECLKHVETSYEKNGGKSLGWLLTNTSSAALCFAREFGIEVEE